MARLCTRRRSRAISTARSRLIGHYALSRRTDPWTIAMARSELGRELRQERGDIRDYLSGLSHEQWQHPSACDGWTVIEVAAHLAGFLSVSVAGLAMRMARAGFFPPYANTRDV